MYPSLAGQHEDYLRRALQEYAKGGRKNPIMKGFAANLKDADIEVIVRYYSRLAAGTEDRAASVHLPGRITPPAAPDCGYSKHPLRTP